MPDKILRVYRLNTKNKINKKIKNKIKYIDVKNEDEIIYNLYKTRLYNPLNKHSQNYMRLYILIKENYIYLKDIFKSFSKYNINIKENEIEDYLKENNKNAHTIDILTTKEIKEEIKDKNIIKIKNIYDIIKYCNKVRYNMKKEYYIYIDENKYIKLTVYETLNNHKLVSGPIYNEIKLKHYCYDNCPLNEIEGYEYNDKKFLVNFESKLNSDIYRELINNNIKYKYDNSGKVNKNDFFKEYLTVNEENIKIKFDHNDYITIKKNEIWKLKYFKMVKTKSLYLRH
uniref:Uncharacterized protein n=1 Tax=Pichia etchellsii TaxID=28550 RepID=Q9C125_PICET|nr:hypothetical protein [Schwanniomyces etchellsii]